MTSKVFCQFFSKVLLKILYITTGTISADQSEHTATHPEETLAINDQLSNADWISPSYAGILIKGRSHWPLQHKAKASKYTFINLKEWKFTLGFLLYLFFFFKHSDLWRAILNGGYYKTEIELRLEKLGMLLCEHLQHFYW